MQPSGMQNVSYVLLRYDLTISKTLYPNTGETNMRTKNTRGAIRKQWEELSMRTRTPLGRGSMSISSSIGKESETFDSNTINKNSVYAAQRNIWSPSSVGQAWNGIPNQEYIPNTPCYNSDTVDSNDATLYDVSTTTHRLITNTD
jgi:hypothetical protein